MASGDPPSGAATPPEGSDLPHIKEILAASEVKYVPYQQPGTRFLPVSRPEPPEQQQHIIREDQLQMFLDAARDGFSDKVTLFLGLGAGLAVSAAEPLYAWICAVPSVPLNGLHFVEALLAVASLSVAGAIHWAAGKKTSKPQALAEELRARHSQQSTERTPAAGPPRPALPESP